MTSFFKLTNNTGQPAENNICFLNASLQALNSVDFCREFFVNRSFDPGDLKFPICDEISRIFKFSSSNFVTSAGTLRALIGTLDGGSYSYYNDGSQQDSSAFLQLLLNIIDTEIVSVTGRKSTFLEEFKSKQKISYNFTATEDGSCPHCGSQAYRREQDFNVLVLIAQNSLHRKKDIKDIITENFDTPAPLLRMRCSACQADTIPEEQKQFAREVRELSLWPNVLIVEVGKFDAYMQKIRRNIFPEDVLQVSSGDSYELVSIINHSGPNQYSGHYVTFVKRENKWYECNDQKLDVRVKDDVISDNNYIYMYQRRKVVTLKSLKSKDCRKPKQAKVQLCSQKDVNVISNRAKSEQAKDQSCSKRDENVISNRAKSKGIIEKSKLEKNKDDKKLSPLKLVDGLKDAIKSTKNSNNYVAPPIYTESSPFDLSSCKVCTKSCKSLMSHLKKSSSCIKEYNIDELKRQLNFLRTNKKSKSYFKRKASMSVDELMEASQQAAKRMKVQRANQTEDEKLLKRETENIARREARANQPEDVKLLKRESKNIAQRKSRANQPEDVKLLKRESKNIAQRKSRANEPEDVKLLKRERKNIAQKKTRANK